jgi:serine/threonine protein kinase
MLSLEGKQLGNYEVIRRIRVGGMGAVYEGKQRTAFDRRVAIKVILGDYATDRDMRRRFAREAQTVARLHHPHILPLIEFGEEQGMLFLVMPFIDGGTLTSYLRRSLPPLAEVAAIYQQLLDAVEYAHDAGLIHRDIKSSNVLLEQRRSGAPYVYLADFGLVRNSRKAELEQTGKPIPLDQVPGTPHYMAPEQTRGIITPSTDIYAMGVIQMHLYTPVPLPSDFDSSIPHELDAVVRTAMAKRSEDRFKTIAELRKAFLAAVKGPIEVVEDLPIEEVEFASQPVVLKRSAHLQELPSPVPMPLPVPLAPPRRIRNEPSPMQVRERHERQEKPRITEDTFKNPKEKQRITEDAPPLRRKPHGVAMPLLATMAIPTVLLLLLLMPRILGISFFPSGFPLFGTLPVATVYVTPQAKTLQASYVLTASPKTTTSDLVTRTIPDHILQGAANASQTVQTTGTKTIAGVQAHGVIEFSNSSNTQVVVNPLVLTTSSGIHIQLTQAVAVPPHQDGKDGKATGIAVAVYEGVNGNIAAHALDTTCCGNGVSAKNNDAFSGGVDGQVLHIVAQADLDTVQNMLLPKLQQQVAQNLHHQLPSTETTAGEPLYTTTVTSSATVGSQVDQVQVQVQVTGRIPSYSRSVMNQVAAQLLAKQAQTLDPGYQLLGSPTVAAPHVDVHGKDGLVYLNVAVHGTWVYVFSSEQKNQWRQSIKGATSAAALAYLNTQVGVASVQIHLPFQADHFPTTTNDITIAIVGDNGA